MKILAFLTDPPVVSAILLHLYLPYAVEDGSGESPESAALGRRRVGIIHVLPAHPIITAPVAAAATGRAKPRVYQGLASLEEAGVLIPLTDKRRNRSWEADGLLSLLEGLEAGRKEAGS